MDLVGAWRRRLLRAGTVAALVPVAIVASLAVVVAGAGGLGGLGSLGQIVTGPAISPAHQAGVASTAGDRDLALVAPPDLLASVQPLAAGASNRGSGQGAAPPRPAQRVTPAVPEVLPPPPPPIGAPPPPPPPAAAAPPAAPTARERTGKVIGELGESVDAVVDGVGEVIGGLGETLGGILDPPPPRR